MFSPNFGGTCGVVSPCPPPHPVSYAYVYHLTDFKSVEAIWHKDTENSYCLAWLVQDQLTNWNQWTEDKLDGSGQHRPSQPHINRLHVYMRLVTILVMSPEYSLHDTLRTDSRVCLITIEYMAPLDDTTCIMQFNDYVNPLELWRCWLDDMEERTAWKTCYSSPQNVLPWDPAWSGVAPKL